MGVEGKRLRYVNVFVLLGRDEDIGSVVKVIEDVVGVQGCRYDVKKSFLGNFYYIKINCTSVDLEDLKNKIEAKLAKLSEVVSWFKTEVIEVR
ncbi:MAG: hypothetical protein LM582_04220 [Desulfurococcaceae archaeon]|jgi:hypothetical protein|nr:hypothetical protein [Desulfurococcaceae archaeon]MCC6057447.1 hypothetical protein [Desulfurococcaceae archaeon]